MTEAVTVALIVSAAPALAAIVSVWALLRTAVVPKLDHITVLTNSTLTAANRRIDELEHEVKELKARL